MLPGEEIADRIIDNLEHLISLLTATHIDGMILSDDAVDSTGIGFPILEIEW